MKTFCMASNLRALVLSNLTPSLIGEFESIVQTSLDGDVRGTLMSDLASCVADSEPSYVVDISKQTPLSSEIYNAFLSLLRRDARLGDGVDYVSHDAWESSGEVMLNPLAQHLGEVRIRGLSFKPRREHVGDSQVLFCTSGAQAEGALSLGQIEDIFIHRRASSGQSPPRDQTFIALKRFAGLTANDQQRDPYKPYKHLRIGLLYQIPIPDVIVIPTTDVVAHFASCIFEDPSLTRSCIVAIPLDRVSSSFPLCAVWLSKFCWHSTRIDSISSPGILDVGRSRRAGTSLVHYENLDCKYFFLINV